MIRKHFKSTLIALAVLAPVSIGVHFLWKHYGHRTIAQQPAAKIALIDISRIRNEAAAFTKFKEILERQYKLFHTEISGTQNELRQKYQEVKDLEKSSKKSGSELQNLKSQLDLQVANLEKQVRDRKEKLSDSFSVITNEIESKIREIVDKIAHRKNLNLVLNANNSEGTVVLFSGDELDITDEVLSELNKQLPTVHLPS